MNGTDDLQALVAAQALIDKQPHLGRYLWAGPMAPIGKPTGEPRRTRVFEPGALYHRMLPLPLDWREKTGQGHEGAVTVGRILGITYGPDHEGQDYCWAYGDYLDEDVFPDARKARMLAEGGVAGPSLDPGGKVQVTVDPATGFEHMTLYGIGGATMVSIPAFAALRQTVFEDGGDWPDDDPDMAIGAGDDCGCADASGGSQRLGHGMALDAVDATLTVNPNGWRGLPLAPRNSVFDNDDAVKRIAAWASAGSQGPDVSKLRRAFMWYDPQLSPTDPTSYRLPVGDIINGRLTLIFHAIYAAAALLSGAHGGLPGIDEKNRAELRNVISEIYPEMATAFNDSSIRAPWDRAAAPGIQLSMIDSWMIHEPVLSAAIGSDRTPSYVNSVGKQGVRNARSYEGTLGDLTDTASPVVMLTTQSGYSETGIENSYGQLAVSSTRKILSVPSVNADACACLKTLESPLTTTPNFLQRKEGNVRYVNDVGPREIDTSTSTTVTVRDPSEDFCAANAISGSENSRTTQCSCDGQRPMLKENSMQFAADEPYGDVKYADPGYRDNQKRYPIDTPEHIRAAWAYINVAKNAAEYDAKQLAKIKSRIMAAAKKAGIDIAGGNQQQAMMTKPSMQYTTDGYPLEPPAAWFQDPKLTKKTKLTVDEDGRVYGHLAAWNECHRDVAMRECVMAPKSEQNYAPFHLGAVYTAEGDLIEVGKIVQDTRHAHIGLGYTAAALHYDNTGDEIAVVRAGEDQFGIWVAGAVVPEATRKKVAKLRRSPLSGDWRRENGSLELTAALAVNAPAFPVYSMENEERLALVAAGSVWPEADEDDDEPRLSQAAWDRFTGDDIFTAPTGIQDPDRRQRYQEIFEDEEIYEARLRRERYQKLFAVSEQDTTIPAAPPVSGAPEMAAQGEDPNAVALQEQMNARFAVIEEPGVQAPVPATAPVTPAPAQ